MSKFDAPDSGARKVQIAVNFSDRIGELQTIESNRAD